MKGFADYIIVGFDEVLREMEREVFGVEAPLKGDLFKTWLVQEKGLSERSASSYLSYINRLDKDLFSEIMDKDFFKLLKEYLAKAPEKAIELMERVQSAIKQEQKKKNPVMPSKTFGNCHSAFVKYMEFITLLIDDDTRELSEECNDTEIDEVPLFEDGHTTFDNDTLSEIFRWRLETQDRLTGSDDKVYYPIRLIKRIFSVSDEDKAYIDKWMTDSINSIDVLTDKGNFKFNEIASFDINNNSGNVSVITNDGTQATMLTHTAEGEMIPMNVKSRTEISIDHSPAIHNILTEKAEELQGLAKLTSIIKDYKANNRKKCSTTVLCTSIFKQNQDELIALVPELKKDLVLIQNSINLELMNRRENSRKHTK